MESARVLQQRLADALAGDAPPETGSWPGALKVLVLVGSSVLLWGAIFAAARLMSGQ